MQPRCKLPSIIDDAYTARMTVVLPAGGTFLCSRQLIFIQPANITGRSYGFAMVGGRSDRTKPRPVLKLADHTNYGRTCLTEEEPGADAKPTSKQAVESLWYLRVALE